MIQDQDAQIIHSNNNTGEDFSEQQLDTITGGCIGCGAIRFKAKAMAKDIANKVPRIADAEKLANKLIMRIFSTLKPENRKER